MSAFKVGSYIDYFKDIASRHVDLKGFYIMDINELANDLRSDMQYPALILVTVTGEIDATNRDNILNTVKGGFMVIDHVTSVDDYTGEIAAMEGCFDIGRDILAKIRYDELHCSDDMLAIDIDGVQHEMMGPLFDNDWGFLFTFDMVYSIGDLSYDASKWGEPKENMSGH